MTSAQKPKFNYKPAFILALLGNALLLGTWMSLLMKSPVEASARLRERRGANGVVVQELYMNYGESVEVICKYPNGKLGTPLIGGNRRNANPTLYCTNVENFR